MICDCYWIIFPSSYICHSFFVTSENLNYPFFRIHGTVRYAISSQAVVLVCLFFLPVMHLGFHTSTEFHTRKLGLWFVSYSV